MATIESIAKTRDIAVQSLRESSPVIAEFLGIETPDLGFFYRDPDYQQAEELKTLAAFNQRVLEALQSLNQPETMTEGKHDASKPKNTRSNR